MFEKLKDQSQNSQSRRSGEKAHHIYTTYKNTVIPHGSHIYAKASDISNATMCTYPQSDHALPHWNVYCGAVLTVIVSIFLTKKQLKSMNKLYPRLGFTFITSLDVVLFMVYFH